MGESQWTTIVVGEDDYKIKCQLPPEGMVYNTDTKVLESTDVICRSLVPAEQHWERPLRPEGWLIKRLKEKALQLFNSDHVDPELETYREREWHRRLYGAWFMNNGRPTFITGTHYFFLTHWVLDVGFPDFRHPDYEFFHAWNHCEKSGDIAGLIILTKRRQGKTAKSAVIMYDRITRGRKRHGGIQSKTFEDARDTVFFEGLIQPFVKMIDFFVPVFDRGRDFPPKEKLRFFKKADRGENIEFGSLTDADQLESWIDLKNSGEKAYDGSKLYMYIGDEVAKTDGVNANKRHYIIRKTLLGQDGFSIIGKALYTTTVEPDEKDKKEGGSNSESFRKLWDQSNQEELEKNGRTPSWMYRFFVPAYKTLFFDIYGFADEDRAKAWLLAERDALRGDPHALAQEIRQNPWTWQESFRSDGDDCLYNPLILEDRLEYLTWRKNLVRRGDLEWTDIVERKEVRFVENPNGRFYVAADPEQPNNVRWVTSERPQPLNILRYIIGIDPFDHVRTKDGRFSMGAAAVYKRYDSMDPEGSDNFVAIYIGRPPHPHIFYEDMVKLCHWYGCQMLYEDNKPNISTYFDVDRGYASFMMRNAKGETGISASTKSHIDIVEETGMFITKNGHRTLFWQFCRGWLDFKIEDTEKFDLPMAGGYALIGNSRMRRGLDRRASKPKLKINEVFRGMTVGSSYHT